MKDYMFLRWSNFNKYRYINDHVSLSNLRFLVDFFSDDYRSYDTDLFQRTLSFYNSNFVYNDVNNKFFYIGCSEWELDEDAYYPSSEEFTNYVNQSNSYKINHDNFIELAANLIAMEKNHSRFALIYRDELDWVHCKGFATQADMELFVKNYKAEVAH